MSIGFDEQERGAADDDAAGWLLRVERADATESDWLALQAWLEASPEHIEAYARVERVAAELSAAAPALLDAMAAPAPLPRRASLSRARTPTRRRVWQGASALAAAAAALVVFVAVRPDAPAAPEVFQTAKGERRVLNLADGSQIHLNGGSRLSVRLEAKARYLELAQGEAAFDVAKDAARPFYVAAGDRTIRVVGTEFDVLRHDGRLKVTVREGVVAVQPAQTRVRMEPVTLRAGDQFDQAAGGHVATVRKVDPEAALAWRDGNLVYRDEPLATVVADLNRYFDTPIRVAGPAAEMRFSGVLRIEDQAAMLRRLQAFLPVSARREADGLVLRANGSRG